MIRYLMLLALSVSFNVTAFADCAEGDVCNQEVTVNDTYTPPPLDLGQAAPPANSVDLQTQVPVNDAPQEAAQPQDSNVNLSVFQADVARGDFQECQRRLQDCGGNADGSAADAACNAGYIHCNQEAQGNQF